MAVSHFVFYPCGALNLKLWQTIELCEYIFYNCLLINKTILSSVIMNWNIASGEYSGAYGVMCKAASSEICVYMYMYLKLARE